MQEWLGKVVDREDLTRHDKWLCMMMPRLKLLRELLREDGVIFVSIDDNEVHHLRMLMDEVFGEENFLTKIAIQSNPRGRQSERYFASVHEYLLVYAKHYDGCILYGIPLTEKQIIEYKFKDQDGRKYRLLGLRQRGAASRREDRPKMFFPIYINDKNGSISLEKTSNHTVKVIPKKSTGEESRWMWSKGKIQENFELLETKFITKRNEWDVFIRDYLTTEGNEERKSKSKTLWVDKSLNYQNGKDELKAIFGESPIEYPKPTSLVNYIAAIAGDLDGIFLDSFAGSGTTAHAVLALNKEDGGNRKFILVECEDYANELTAERVRRVIKGVTNAKDDNLKKGLGGTFSYFELGKAIELESILSGDGLPTYEELARYIFYTATGEEFDPKAMNEKKNFVGESKNYMVYLFYEPNIEKLKNIALTLDRAESIGKPGKKRRLIFAPTKYLDQTHLDELRIDFAQLPFEIYELAR